jgi:tetratricopeptide (TPR) repeat protein
MQTLLESIATLVSFFSNGIGFKTILAFVAAYVLVKFLLYTSAFQRLTGSRGFRAVNRTFNVIAVGLAAVVLASFGAYFSTQRAKPVRAKSRDREAAKVAVAKIVSIAELTKATTTPRLKNAVPDPSGFGQITFGAPAEQRLLTLSPLIYDIGVILDPDVAFDLVRELNSRFGIPELSPAFLGISPDAVTALLIQPFNYSSVHAPRLFYKGPRSVELTQADATVLEYLAKDDLRYPYKDFVYFLRGEYDLLKSQYPSSRLVVPSAYSAIRDALRRGAFEECINRADEFRGGYPNNEFADDAQSLKVVALEMLGKPIDAVRAAIDGMRLPDGDMKAWFNDQVFTIMERQMAAADLRQLIRENILPSWRIPMIYTLANHEAADGRFDEALRLLSEVGKPNWKTVLIGVNRGYLPVEPDLNRDAQIWQHLVELEQDKSPAGQYRKGLFLYETPLVLYNQLHAAGFVGRGQMPWKAMTNRTPERYYLKRNNYLLAAHAFEAAATSPDKILRQKAYYKAGRSYEHLAEYNSFRSSVLEGRTRLDDQRKSAELFLRSYQEDPRSELADDALLEGAVHTLPFDSIKGQQLIGLVGTQYPGRNTAPYVIFHQAGISEEAGKHREALEMLQRIPEGKLTAAVKEQVRIIEEHMR